jgi:hypothetical protein
MKPYVSSISTCDEELTISFCCKVCGVEDTISFQCPIKVQDNPGTVCEELERFMNRIRYLTAWEDMDEDFDNDQ